MKITELIHSIVFVVYVIRSNLHTEISVQIARKIQSLSVS